MQDQEIKFGYAVTGAIDPERILTNAGAQAGRRAVPHQAARHRHRRHRDQVRPGRPRRWRTQAVESMRTLNRAAAEALQPLPAGAVHACTDITGFGLAGHAQRDGARRAA